MNIEKINENVIRSQGYAQGFKDGYQACAMDILKQVEKENQENKKEESKT